MKTLLAKGHIYEATLDLPANPAYWAAEATKIYFDYPATKKGSDFGFPLVCEKTYFEAESQVERNLVLRKTLLAAADILEGSNTDVTLNSYDLPPLNGDTISPPAPDNHLIRVVDRLAKGADDKDAFTRSMAGRIATLKRAAAEIEENLPTEEQVELAQQRWRNLYVKTVVHFIKKSDLESRTEEGLRELAEAGLFEEACGKPSGINVQFVPEHLQKALGAYSLSLAKKGAAETFFLADKAYRENNAKAAAQLETKNAQQKRRDLEIKAAGLLRGEG